MISLNCSLNRGLNLENLPTKKLYTCKVSQSGEKVLIVHVEAATLIAHITTGHARHNSTQFTTPKDYAHVVDPEC